MELPDQPLQSAEEHSLAPVGDSSAVADLLQQAEDHLEEGELLKAQALCEQALQIRPRDPEALALLGDVQLDRGEIEKAVVTYRRSLELRPGLALVHARLGVALREQGKVEEALACFHRALQEDPAYPEALADLGLTLCQAGQVEEAASAFRQALELEPAMVDVRLLLADVLEALGQEEEALSAYREVLASRPDDPEAQRGARGLLLKQRAFEEVILLCRQRLASHPEDLLALLQLGDALMKCRRYDDALLAFRRAGALHREEEAPLDGLGQVLNFLGCHEEAIETYSRALDLRPHAPELMYGMGNSLQLHGQFNQSVAVLRRAIEVRPDYANAHRALSHSLLSQGNFAEGWREWEWRWRSDGWDSPALATKRPLWAGEKTSERVLMWEEQGIGDTIMFLSLLREASFFADSLIVQVDPRLLPLLDRSFAPPPAAEGTAPQPPRGRLSFIDKTLPVLQDLYSAHLPLGSLPQHFRRSTQDFRRQPKGYLLPDPVRSRSLRKRLGGDGRLICGISWRSINTMIGDWKSLPLAPLAEALARPEVRLVSLQYGEVAGETDALRRDTGIEVFEEPSIDNFHDIDGLASLIDACDLVVSISNTTVHLAGALGKPTWVLLHDVPDWRWGLEGSDALWYPSLRLFRQQARGDWSPVLEQVSGALNELLHRPPGLLPLFDA
jgi:tetratricopeptide (TPR) repeat protein